MQALVQVVMPVFLVLGLGYFVRWRGWMGDAQVDALMQFAQSFALPLLLFRAVSQIDIGASFDPPLLIAFFSGALAAFAFAFGMARLLFRRSWEDCIAIGFTGCFSNTLLLGLPITERAWGPGALAGNFAIISLHAPLLYALGVTLMETVKSRGGSPLTVLLRVLRGMARTPLVVGLICGLSVNLVGLPTPKPLGEAMDMLGRTALPAALFALGGVLFRYRPEGDMRLILTVCAASLVLHPAVTWALAQAFGLSDAALRSAVVTAAMAPGVNAYLFANVYGVAKRVSASAVLIGTAMTVLTAWIWLQILP